MLLDQTDFLVVGVIGPQGAGKSTVLSVVAGAGHFSRFVNIDILDVLSKWQCIFCDSYSHFADADINFLSNLQVMLIPCANKTSTSEYFKALVKHKLSCYQGRGETRSGTEKQCSHNLQSDHPA